MLLAVTVIASIVFWIHIAWLFISSLSKGNNYNQNIRIVEGKAVGNHAVTPPVRLIDDRYDLETTTLVGKATAGQVTSSLTSIYVELHDMRTGMQHYMNLEKELLLGRQLAGEMVREDFLNDPTVSQKHCRIYRQGEQIFLQDLGSKNHTWLNGSLVEGSMPLSFGDKIRIGQSTLRFQCYR